MQPWPQIVITAQGVIQLWAEKGFWGVVRSVNLGSF